MKYCVCILPALLATALAVQLPTVEYLPPAEENFAASSNVVESNFLDVEPAHALTDDGYRYKTIKRYRLHRHRRDVNELSNEYLPPHHASFGAASETAPVYASPVQNTIEAVSSPVYEVAAAEPIAAHSLSSDGYRYKTIKRYRYRHRY